MENRDRLGVRLRPKVRMLKVEVIETLLYGCVTWGPRKPDYDRIRQGHTSCTSDVSAGGNGSATTTPSRKPTRLPNRLREHGGDGAESKDVVREIPGKYVQGAPAAEVDFGEMIEVKRYTPGGKRTIGWCVYRNTWRNSPWNPKAVTKCCTKCRQIVSTGRRGCRGIYAEKA